MHTTHESRVAADAYRSCDFANLQTLNFIHISIPLDCINMCNCRGRALAGISACDLIDRSEWRKTFMLFGNRLWGGMDNSSSVTMKLIVSTDSLNFSTSPPLLLCPFSGSQLIWSFSRDKHFILTFMIPVYFWSDVNIVFAVSCCLALLNWCKK